MKIMLEMTNYAKNYANTIYQSLMRKLREKADERKRGRGGFPPSHPPLPTSPKPSKFFSTLISLCVIACITGAL